MLSYIDNIKLKNFTVIDVNSNNFNELEILKIIETKAIIYLFDFKMDHKTKSAFSSKKISVKKFNIIYNLFEDFDKFELKEGQFKTREFSINTFGFGTIKKIFEITTLKAKTKISGCVVNQGCFRNNGKYRLFRNGKIVAEDLTISSLKKFKNEVEVIEQGEETGVSFMNFEDFQVEDEIECYF